MDNQISKIPSPPSRLLGVFKTFGIGKEKEYFAENLALMVASEIPIASALRALESAIRSGRLLKIIKELEADINGGLHFWEACAKTGLFAEYAIYLIKIGEESGQLTENLKLLSKQQQKDRLLSQRVRSAMFYPAIVFSLTLILGTAIAWFILPRLAGVFASLKLHLPWPTRVLIALGTFLSHWGAVVIPLGIVAILILFYFIFLHPRGKALGQKILFVLPGVKDLIQDVELSRFGYILGGVLSSGVPIIAALDLLSQASTFFAYKKLFLFLRQSLEEGNSFQKSFARYKNLDRLIPVPVQQIIVAGEASGKLEQTLLSISQTYEEKSESSAKDLTVIIEPLLLVVVWGGVVVVALAVILPLYNLIGGLQAGPITPQPAPVRASKSSSETKQPPAPAISAQGGVRGAEISVIEFELQVLPTVKYLNLRKAPTVSSPILGKIYPGQILPWTAREDNWYLVRLPDGGGGWVIGDYVKVIE